MAIYGNNNSNSLNGTNNSDHIYGYGGNDNLYGYGGNDYLDGGSGNDQLSGGTGIDTAMYLDATTRVTVSLLITVAQDTHGAGTDTLSSIEQIQGSGYDDTLRGDNGNNRLYGWGGEDHLYGNGGNDRIWGNNDSDWIYGGAGNDYLNGGEGDDYLLGGSGTDTLSGGTGTDRAMYYNASAGVIVSLLTTTAQDTFGAGSDTLIGIEDIQGSEYGDTLAGDNANNRLDGWGGNDTLYGNGGTDVLVGGDNDDILDGGDGIDTLYGGNGNDSYFVNVTGDVISEMNDAGTDTVISSVTRTLGANQENLTLAGTMAIKGTGNDLNNSLTGNGAANTLDGMNGDDILLGKRGRDILVGRFGNDTISGGGQNDTLFGRDGNDTLTGGNGADIFVFDCVLNSASNNDNITDFSHVDDTIRLNKTVFTNFSIGTLLSTQFRASAAGTALDQNDFFLYNTSSGALFYDADGSGSSAAIQFATLTNQPQNVTYNDFVVVA